MKDAKEWMIELAHDIKDHMVFGFGSYIMNLSVVDEILEETLREYEREKKTDAW